MTIRDKVQAILSKNYTEYNSEDVDKLTKIKQEIGQLVADAKNEVLKFEQLEKQEKAETTMKLYGEFGSLERAKVQTIILIKEISDKYVKAQYDYEKMKNYYDDLKDIVISVRQTAAKFDLPPQK